jgi:hypothetical protein
MFQFLKFLEFGEEFCDFFDGGRCFGSDEELVLGKAPHFKFLVDERFELLDRVFSKIISALFRLFFFVLPKDGFGAYRVWIDSLFGWTHFHKATAVAFLCIGSIKWAIATF